MKNYWKMTSLVLALALALSVGGNFVSAQTAPAVTTRPPDAGPGLSVRGDRGGQPHMEMALVALNRAKDALKLAKPDKGGNREKAIASVDVAIHDTEYGIKYAKDHPEEFMRGRGPGEDRGGPPGGPPPGA